MNATYPVNGWSLAHGSSHNEVNFRLHPLIFRQSILLIGDPLSVLFLVKILCTWLLIVLFLLDNPHNFQRTNSCTIHVVPETHTERSTFKFDKKHGFIFRLPGTGCLNIDVLSFSTFAYKLKYFRLKYGRRLQVYGLRVTVVHGKRNWRATRIIIQTLV